jgi:hypothetical protein
MRKDGEGIAALLEEHAKQMTGQGKEYVGIQKFLVKGTSAAIARDRYLA